MGVEDLLATDHFTVPTDRVSVGLIPRVQLHFGLVEYLERGAHFGRREIEHGSTMGLGNDDPAPAQNVLIVGVRKQTEIIFDVHRRSGPQ